MAAAPSGNGGAPSPHRPGVARHRRRPDDGTVIHDVDESLRALLAHDANGAGFEVVFDAPTKEWAARRSAPTVDVFLYDIREDLQRRDMVHRRSRDDAGVATARRPPARRFRLSYLLTAWTQRPEDEHRILSQLMLRFLRIDRIPDDLLVGSLPHHDVPVIVNLAMPQSEDRSLSDIWSALGGELKPSLDLQVVAPIDPGRETKVGPPVVEGIRLKGKRPPLADRPDPDELTEVAVAGDAKKPGRTLRVHGRPATGTASSPAPRP